MRFSMNIVKPVNIPLYFHCKFSSSLCSSTKEENNYMCRVQYRMKDDVCNGMFKYFTCSWCCQWTHGKWR
jgi:hypothetical protein